MAAGSGDSGRRMSAAAFVTHRGRCHCGAVRFEVDAPRVIEAYACNCSLCTKTAFLHLIVPKERFRIVAGGDRLTEYTFNTRTARHLFCRDCGVKGFYVPRSNPDGWSVNVRCLDGATIERVDERPFDGANWERAQDLSHLTADR